MFGVLQAQNALLTIVHWAVVVVMLFAFISSLLYSEEAYRAAGKWSKQGWAIVLGLGVVVQVLTISIPLVGLALLIAAFVYLADVRPALNSLTRRR